MLSFSLEEFLLVLESYNLAIWPLQIIAYVLIVLVLFFSLKPTKYSTKIVLAILSFFWLFTGIVFCLLYWAPTHIFGYIFGVCCIAQGLLFLYSITRSDITISSPDKTYTFIGILFVLYAIIGYQVFGYYLGHIYPKFFAVGLVPCPTTIFTLGIFLIINKKIPIKYFVIPLMISLGGFLAAYNGIYEDIGLIIAGILSTILIMQKNARVKRKDLKTT
ncbi:MAG: DUF6064 family protein [Candidatus Lokiarchaeota archaeon]|nr:DUF6064 family protein [Candidatus Lokiarchaeota archaeon]